MLEPSYSAGVEAALDRVENDESRAKLWSAIVEALNFILDHPDDSKSRRFALRQGNDTLWRVPIASGSVPENWTVLWAEGDGLARFMYVGPWPPEPGFSRT